MFVCITNSRPYVCPVLESCGIAVVLHLVLYFVVRGVESDLYYRFKKAEGVDSRCFACGLLMFHYDLDG
jgi:hypothetical protein